MYLKALNDKLYNSKQKRVKMVKPIVCNTPTTFNKSNSTMDSTNRGKSGRYISVNCAIRLKMFIKYVTVEMCMTLTIRMSQDQM